MVELVAGVVDYGDAPEIYVSGPSRISRISQNLVRLTFYAEREAGEGVERRAVLHVLRDPGVLVEDWEAIGRAVVAALTEPPLHRDTRRRVGSH